MSSENRNHKWYPKQEFEHLCSHMQANMDQNTWDSSRWHFLSCMHQVGTSGYESVLVVLTIYSNSCEPFRCISLHTIPLKWKHLKQWFILAPRYSWIFVFQGAFQQVCLLLTNREASLQQVLSLQIPWGTTETRMPLSASYLPLPPQVSRDSEAVLSAVYWKRCMVSGWQVWALCVFMLIFRNLKLRYNCIITKGL